MRHALLATFSKSLVEFFGAEFVFGVPLSKPIQSATSLFKYIEGELICFTLADYS